MAAQRRDYIITHHLRERFVQRTNKRYSHLQQCKQDGCEKCKELLAEIKAEVSFKSRLIDERIYDYLGQAEENRSYLNNTEFMEWYHSKYGFDKRFEFLVHDDLLFVVVWDNGKKVVVTCVAARTHIAGRSHLSKPKFNKVKTKEVETVTKKL